MDSSLFVGKFTESVISLTGDIRIDVNSWLLIPFAILWISAYIYCFRNLGGIEAFARCSAVHQLHAAGVCFLASLSLYFDNDAIFSESIPIFFSSTYFVVDFVDCLLREDAMFLIHAALSLCLGHWAYVEGPFREMRLMSRGYMIELSNIQLHRWKVNKTKSNFTLFVFLFTVTRICFLPVFIMREVALIVGFRDIIFVALVVLYALQFGWWVKMVQMLLNYKVKVVEMEKTVYSSGANGETLKPSADKRA